MRSLQRAATKANTASITTSILRFNSTVAKSTSAAPRALSNAYIGNLESRWTSLPKQDQQTLIDELKSRMELPWQELTPAEKKLLIIFHLVNGGQELHYIYQVKDLKYFGLLLVVLLLQ